MCLKAFILGLLEGAKMAIFKSILLQLIDVARRIGHWIRSDKSFKFHNRQLSLEKQKFRQPLLRKCEVKFLTLKKNGWKEDHQTKFWKSIINGASWFAEILSSFVDVLKHLEQLSSSSKTLRLDNLQSHIQKTIVSQGLLFGIAWKGKNDHLEINITPTYRCL
jgi:hypothetical protein